MKSPLVLPIHYAYTIFPGPGDVWFSLNNTTYQNNSCVALEDIGECVDALLCLTNQSACCTSNFTEKLSTLGNWFFPNGTRISSKIVSKTEQRDFYQTRGWMSVGLNHRRGGVEGIYRCEIHESMNVTQTIYIGMYTACTGEGKYLYTLFCSTKVKWHVYRLGCNRIFCFKTSI